MVSDLVRNAPGPPSQDFANQNRLDSLRDVETGPKKGTTTIIFLLHHHHPQFSLALVRSYHHLHQNLCIHHTSVFNSFQPPPSRSDSSFGNFHIPAQLSSPNFGNREQRLSGNIFCSQTNCHQRKKTRKSCSGQCPTRIGQRNLLIT